MNWREILRKQFCIPRRRLLVYIGILVAASIAYPIWSPGEDVRDGRHDLGANGIWIQHGWLGADLWFNAYGRDPTQFRSDDAVQRLANQLRGHGIRFVYPHLAPCDPDGKLPGADSAQTERFLDEFAEDFAVLPWIGGVNEVHCRPESPDWRAAFTASASALLVEHPRFAGLHLNVEPMESGDPDFLILLDELRAALPSDKILSIAAYPPPTRWHPFSEVHWDENYYREVTARVDQAAVMMYDTALPLGKLYQRLMADWTEQILNWSAPNCQILLGLPAYDDADTGYHKPGVENLKNGLLGLHAGLARFEQLPAGYAGVAIYCEWEMDEVEWMTIDERFRQASPEKPGRRTAISEPRVFESQPER